MAAFVFVEFRRKVERAICHQLHELEFMREVWEKAGVDVSAYEERALELQLLAARLGVRVPRP